MWTTVEADTDPVNQKQDKINYLKQIEERKFNASDSFMLVMAVPAVLSKTLEVH